MVQASTLLYAIGGLGGIVSLAAALLYGVSGAVAAFLVFLTVLWAGVFVESATHAEGDGP